MRRLNYSDVIRTEDGTRAETSSRLRGAEEYIPLILDVFFQLMYFTGQKKDETPEGQYFEYCWHQYYHSGYSLRASIILYERGYYLEANIILRRLLEILVKMRYFENHKEFAYPLFLHQEVFITIAGRKKRLSIKHMFSEVAPDLYENVYGLLLSGYAHGGIGSSLGKISYKSKKPKVMLGSLWSEEEATFVLNTFTVIALGYLKFFPRAFKEGCEAIDPEIKRQSFTAIEWLAGSLSNHRRKYPDKETWHKAIAPLINL